MSTSDAAVCVRSDCWHIASLHPDAGQCLDASCVCAAFLFTREAVEGRNHLAEPKSAFEGGSTRSVKLERYDLIPHEIDEALALRFGLGAVKHGDNNWKSGGADFIRSCFNHLRAHYVSLLKNGPFHEDDDIGAMLWNIGVLAWFRVHKPGEFQKAIERL